ncbi:CDHR5 isoform 9 [Pongo abelii]|uniref:Cadherin-related family member 5 n=1 Tax=Pongo abelii TaxID=9601 RepID=A0A2J8XRV6_PONAB|nr:CDHR5 isoform 9 [Pongo abelii]
MGSWALLWPSLLLTGLLGRPPGTVAQAQYCSVNKNIFEVEENKNVTEPLVDIHVPEGQEVTLGPLSTPFAFRIQGNQLFLNMTPDYEDTKVNSTVIPETQLQAEDRDKDDILFYTLQEMTAGASDYFSLVSVNHPALRLDRPLDFYERPNMAFRLLVRDTPEENVQPSHTATATLVLNVVPADLRPPWFLPCTFSDGYVCIQAQYHGAVPTGHTLPSPLVLRPGPIYAEDGDRGINQPIIYSIFSGNVNGTFVIHPDSGNLTMARSVPSPVTFLLLVKGQQADLARYSVTQVTVEAVAAAGSPPRFPQSLYRGTVALGAGAGTVVKDAAAPSQPLRIQAQDPEFSVEANNTVTSGTAITVIEIQVSEQEPPSTGGGPLEDKRFSVVDMAALGGVLGALLLLALLGLAVLVHKHYGPRLKCCSGKAPEPQPQGFDNQAFLPDHKANWAPVPSPTRDPKPTEAPTPAEPEPPGPASTGGAPEPPAAARAGGSPTAVRSILTKERRPEGGYKAVWFGEDIGAEADVVVLNAPTLDVDGASDEGSGDEGKGAGRGGGPHDAPGGDDSYI